MRLLLASIFCIYDTVALIAVNSAHIYILNTAYCTRAKLLQRTAFNIPALSRTPTAYAEIQAFQAEPIYY